MAEPIRADNIPRHIAIIMDGNGRWAEARGLARIEGHRAGIESVREVVRGAHDLGVHYLTLYAFSTENWNRPRAEVDALMRLLERYLERELEEVHSKGIRIRVVGRSERLPKRVRQRLDDAVARTQANREMELIFALSYGSRTEIADAARRIAQDVERGELPPEQIDEKVFAAYLYAPHVPDPDLLIRTGGEARVSNFLLWQIAYTELFISDVMWPDFRAPHLAGAVEAYKNRERRYGLTSAQRRRERA